MRPSPFSSAALRSRGFPCGKGRENYGANANRFQKKHPVISLSPLHKPFTGRGYFFSLNTSALVFLRLLTLGSLAPSPFSFAVLRSRGFPHSKSQENYGSFPLNRSKKYPLPVNGCRPCPAAGAVCLLQGFDRGPDCTASFGLR